MCHLFESIFSCMLVVVVGVNILAMIHLSRFLTRLKQCHPLEWGILGKPSISDNEIVFKDVGMITYFAEKHYKKLDDTIAVDLGYAAGRWLGMGGVLGIVLLVLFVAGQFLLRPMLESACWFM